MSGGQREKFRDIKYFDVQKMEGSARQRVVLGAEGGKKILWDPVGNGKSF